MKISSEPPKRTLPPPFERPKIEISAVKRSWQTVFPDTLSKNDVVPDMGLITEVINLKSTNNLIRIVGASRTEDFEADVKIFAFTRTPT